MDGTTLSDFELEKLNEQDKQQLRTFLNNENQKARVQSSKLAYYNSTCICPDTLFPLSGRGQKEGRGGTDGESRARESRIQQVICRKLTFDVLAL
jgi:hypothetical protein